MHSSCSDGMKSRLTTSICFKITLIDFGKVMLQLNPMLTPTERASGAELSCDQVTNCTGDFKNRKIKLTLKE